MQQIVDSAERDASPYFQELRQNRRALIAASAGMGAGFLLNHYVANLFAPRLLEEFGWSRSDFARIGALSFVTVLIVPIVGRLTDLVA